MKSVQPTPKAGRNLPAAIASGVALVVIVILSLFTLKWIFGVVAIIALLIAVREFVTVLSRRNISVSRTPVYLATVLIPAAAYIWGFEAQLIATGFLSSLSCFGEFERVPQVISLTLAHRFF